MFWVLRGEYDTSENKRKISKIKHFRSERSLFRLIKMALRRWFHDVNNIMLLFVFVSSLSCPPCSLIPLLKMCKRLQLVWILEASFCLLVLNSFLTCCMTRSLLEKKVDLFRR